MKSTYTHVDLPDFGLATVEPVLSVQHYRTRLDRAAERARAQGLDVLVVYADREHFANLTYLTGCDPRFEEALLVIDVERGGAAKPTLLVGNEGLGYCRISPVHDQLEIVLYETFSLLGQPRGTSSPLGDILRAAGVRPEGRIGVVGWKHFDARETAAPALWLDAPAYIVDTLRDLVGDNAAVTNANALFKDSSNGLRSVNEVDQLARFEFAATLPYFETAAAWYETVGIGVSGDTLYRTVHDRIGDPFFGVKLNPGHLIHLDEWVNSPVYAGSSETLVSGMAIQVDIIPATGTPYYTSNIEDGIALADEALRDAFASRYPEAWGRIQARRIFMQETLGIRLKPEVLPFSNIPAYLPPFLLAPDQALVMR
jgi:hypothetical protein